MLYIKIFDYKSSIVLMAVFTLLLVVVGVYLPFIVGLSESLIKFVNGPLGYDKIMNKQSLTIYTSSIPLQIPLSFYMLSNRTGFAADVGLATINSTLTIILGLDEHGYSALGLGQLYPNIIVGEGLAKENDIGINNTIIISSNYCNRILVTKAKILPLNGVLNYSIIAPLNVSLKLNCRLPNTVSVFYIIEKELVERYARKKYMLNIIIPGYGRITIRGLDGSLFYDQYVDNNISLILPFGGYIISFNNNISYYEEILLTNNTTIVIPKEERLINTTRRPLIRGKETCIKILYWDGRKYNGSIMISLKSFIEYYKVSNGEVCMYLANDTYTLKLLNASVPVSWRIRAGEERTIFIPPPRIIRRIEPLMIQEFFVQHGFNYKYVFLLAIGLGASVIISLLFIVLIIIIPAPIIVGKTISLLLSSYYYKLLRLSNNRDISLKIVMRYVITILLLSVLLASTISYMLVSGREVEFVVYKTIVNPMYSFIGISIMSMTIILSSLKEFRKMGDYY